jgi:hypothetical protein
VPVTATRAQPAAKRPAAWAITLAATAVSTYALDAVATVAGIALAASQALAGLGVTALAALLAVTYVVWGAGLRVNLRANWLLLEATGASTNAPSKAAFDLARRRGASVRARRLASAGGYVATELAKELPYYAGAFGAALASDGIAARDALIFLIGTNLGAAAYEYGVGRLTHAFLSARAPVRSGDERRARPAEAAGRDAAAVAAGRVRLRDG